MDISAKTLSTRKGGGMLAVYTIVLLWLDFFYLIPLPGTFGGNTNNILPMFVIVLSFAFMALTNSRLIMTAAYAPYYLLLFCFWIFEIVYTILRYPTEPAINAVIGLASYLVMLSYFVFLRALRKDANKMMKFLINSTTIAAALLLVQSVAYNLSGIQFLKVYGFTYGKINLLIRNDNVRLLGSELIGFMAFLSAGKAFDYTEPGKKTMYWVNIVVVTAYVLYTTQTRSMSLILIVILIVMLLRFGPRKKVAKVITFFLAIVFLGLAADSIYSGITSTFSLITERQDYSLYHRADAYQYYLKTGLAHPFTGIGLLPDQTVDVRNYRIVHGNLGSVYGYSDVGIVGVLGKLGVTGVLFYLFPLFRIWKQYRKWKDPVLLSIFLAYASSTLTLSLFDAERLMVFTLFLAVSEVRIEKLRRMNA